MCLAWDRVQIVLAARTRVHTFVSVVDSLARFTLLQPLSRFAFIFTIPVDGEKKIGWETALASPALAQRRTATYRQYEFDDVFAAYIKIGHRVAPKRDNATCCYAISFDFHVAVAIAIATFSLRGNQKKENRASDDDPNSIFPTFYILSLVCIHFKYWWRFSFLFGFFCCCCCWFVVGVGCGAVHVCPRSKNANETTALMLSIVLVILPAFSGTTRFYSANVLYAKKKRPYSFWR